MTGHGKCWSKSPPGSAYLPKTNVVVFSYQTDMFSQQRIASQGKEAKGRIIYFIFIIFIRFLASLLVELGEYDISGPNEAMSTREKKVKSLNQLQS